jgi:hypothetical protein
MALIVSATVIRWGLKAGAPPKVVFETEEEISLYTSGDGTEPPGAHDVKIMAEYILKHGALKELLTAAREGLLKVTDVKIRVIHPPPVPGA